MLKKEKSVRNGMIVLVALFMLLSFVSAQDAGTAIESTRIDAKELLSDIKYLSSDSLKGRETGTPENAIAREFVLKRFKDAGIEPLGDDYLYEFSFSDRRKKEFKGVNVVGYVKGTMNPEKYIVVSAHYDHVGVRNGQIYNGADDNASGTAALFAIAKYFKKNPPNNSVVFAAFDGEEKGLQGAREFVRNLPISKDSILLNVNMDMISRNDKNQLYAAGTFHNPQFKPMLQKVQEKAPIKLLLGHDNPKMGRDDWTSQSDQGAFHASKIPFIYFGVEDHKDYHKPTDVYENIQPGFYVKAVETIVMAVESIDENVKAKL